MSDDVLRIRTPIGIKYQYSAGPRVSSHLLGLMDGRFVGKRCPNCHLVYMPPRNGTCAKCGCLLGEDVEVGQRGTITTFCIVNVPFLGQTIKIPYVAATILLDGADMGMSHLIQEVEAADVRMGMRVEPVWRPRDEWQPSMENVMYFRPTGEPDAAFESYAGQL